LLPPGEVPVKYVIQPGLSRITVKAFASGFLAGLGHSPTFAARDYTGEADLDGGAGTARVEIKAASLELTDQVSEMERRQILQMMHEKVLESAKFPTIVFECPALQVAVEGSRYTITANGELSLHGVTRPFPITVKAMRLGDTLRANGELPLSLQDFRISPPSIAGSMLKIKDELKLAFNLAAREQP
jgi:polyisoprenoid-binding protein YceI